MSTRHVQLGDIIDESSPGFASGDDLDVGVAQVRMNNVTRDGTLDWSRLRRVSDKPRRTAKYALRAGDILFNSTNSPELVGKTALFQGSDETVVFSNHFIRIRLDCSQADPAFVAWSLVKRWQQRTFENLCTRWVNQASVRQDDLFDLFLALPPLPEQRRIAAQLEQADRLRRTRRYTLDLSDSFLPATFRRMFAKCAAPLTPLGELVTSGPQNGLYKPSSCYGAGTLIVRIDAYQNGDVVDMAALKRVRLEPDEIANYGLCEGDFLINRVNSRSHLGKATRVGRLHEPAVFESNMMRFRVDEARMDPCFLNHCVQTPAWNRQIQTLAKDASNQSSINQEDVGSLRIPLPPLAQQRAFAAIVAQHERLRATQRESLRQAEHLFQTLLHRAFAGA